MLSLTLVDSTHSHVMLLELLGSHVQQVFLSRNLVFSVDISVTFHWTYRCITWLMILTQKLNTHFVLKHFWAWFPEIYTQQKLPCYCHSLSSREVTVSCYRHVVSLCSTENRMPLMTPATEEKPPTPPPPPPPPSHRHNDNSLSIPQSPNFPCRLSRSGSASAALAARLSRKASGESTHVIIT